MKLTFKNIADSTDVTHAMCVQLGLNFNGAAPEWVELLPAGERIIGRDGRNWIANPSGVLAAFQADTKTLPIDYEHATEIKGSKGEAAPAVAWIVELEVRAGGSVWGRVYWNEEGRQAVESRKYRYLSPVFTFSKSGVIQCLLSAGLTNMPNLQLTALNHANYGEVHMTELTEDERAACRLTGTSEEDFIKAKGASNV